MTPPKFSQTWSNLSLSASANLVSSWTMRFATPFLIAAKTALSWIISRETFSGRSAESTTRRTKRSQFGTISASDEISTRRT